MADKHKEDKQKDKKTTSNDAESKIGILTWVIMLVVVALLSGSGFVLGHLVAGSMPSDASEAPEESIPQENESSSTTTPGASQDSWYYNELESVVVNPDEPGATRFVRVGLILEMSNEVGEVKARALIETKKPLLINWLNLYFKSLSLSEMKDERDMNRILSQACDEFNLILFPDSKPQIKKILIREFNIQ